MSFPTEIKAVFQEPIPEYEDISISLEQEPWEDTTGLMKKSDFYQLIYMLLNYNEISGTMDCSVDSKGNARSAIYVYVYPKDLQYKLKINYGRIGSRQVQYQHHTEVISFSIANTHSLGKMPIGRVSWTWLGKVYDETGTSIRPPTVTVDEKGDIFLTKKVYGDLKLTYTYCRHKYIFEANVSEGFVSSGASTGEAVNNLIAYAIWTRRAVGSQEERGGIVWINLTPPPNSDANGEQGADCGWYIPDDEEDEDFFDEEPDEDDEDYEDDETEGDYDPDLDNEDTSDDDDTEPEEYERERFAPFTDRISMIDYCTQEVKYSFKTKRSSE